MDAVAEIREHAEHALKGWLEDGDTVLKTAQAAGVDLPGVFAGQRVLRTLSGSIPEAGGGATATRPRARRATRRRSTNGAGPSDERIIGALTDMGGANQSQLATRLGTSRQTVAKRLDALTRAGKVTLQGAGSRKTWHPAGQGA